MHYRNYTFCMCKQQCWTAPAVVIEYKLTVSSHTVTDWCSVWHFTYQNLKHFFPPLENETLWFAHLIICLLKCLKWKSTYCTFCSMPEAFQLHVSNPFPFLFSFLLWYSGLTMLVSGASGPVQYCTQQRAASCAAGCTASSRSHCLQQQMAIKEAYDTKECFMPKAAQKL